MKYYCKTLRTIVLFIFLYPELQAQTAEPLFAGTKTPYIRPVSTYTPIPKGYRAVFVNYVGRHGARFMTKSGADKEAFELLQIADEEGALTDTGLRIKNSVQNMLSVQREGYEKITLLGAEEQEAIGGRLYENYRTAFSGRGIQVQYTFKVRTKQSADAFLKAYSKYPSKIISEKNAESSNTNLRFYDLSPAYTTYKDGKEVRLALDSLNADPRNGEIVRQVCLKLFTQPYAESLIRDGKAEGFVENLYDLYAAAFAVRDEMYARGLTSDSINLKIVFNDSSLRWMDFRAGAADFLEKGPGRDADGIQVKVAVPLLADFLSTTDSAIVQKNVDAKFRFTHAEAISPFATLLAIPKASKTSSTIFDYAKNWKTEEIIPLSANIQWILYSDGKHNLVKVLLNEREILLPIKSVFGPYYDWVDFKKFYLKKLRALNANPNADMLTYLKTLQP